MGLANAVHNGSGVVSENELDDDLERQTAFMIRGPEYDFDGGWDLDLTPVPCPDEIPVNYELDARLWTGRFDGGRCRESKRMHFASRDEVTEFCDAAKKEIPRRLRESWGGGFDGFAYGAQSAVTGASPLTSPFIPLLPGPVTRQLYWQDYFAMSAKAFEAYNHDPLSWRAVHILQQFVLGRGVRAKVTKSGPGGTHDEGQKRWDDFWAKNKMDNRLAMMVRDRSIYGEQMNRFFPDPGDPKGLLVRSIDPASVYDIVTDQEDHETVFFYHQQFQTPYQLYAPPSGRPAGQQQAPSGATLPGAVTRFIIRQIDAGEIDHYKINVGSSERRGRSDLYPVLGWIKRTRDYLTSRVIQADMQARYAYDLTVNGSASDVTAVRGQMFPGGKPPAPGSILGHTQAVTLTGVNFQAAAVSAAGDPVFDALVNMVAIGAGVPKEWLGFSSRGGARANALVATEPGAKRMEDVQGDQEEMLQDIAKRVFERAGISDAEIEFTFPSIATEDRSAKLDDLGTAESNGWISKATAAEIAAKELGIDGYSFDQEQKRIAKEFPEAEKDADGTLKQGDGTVRRPMLMATKRQAAKLDVTKSPSAEDDPPGLLMPTDGSPVAGADPSQAPQPQTRAGFPGDENPLSGAGAKNIRKDNAMKESRVDISVDELMALMREARAPRRRPDDPEFKAAAEEFRRRSAENLGEMVRDATR